ncbi:conserved domain protein [Methylocaldum marinum]|uniref:Conserved domain protein n=1 Tax=Methylocaldum marinum TaxID=1432792 RepID=A0A250KXJ0_9GAMM|nr:SPOR domain-containing protein [Methylocaldum marinum]BBA36345.1 conserved domain protein [Methylocaldum marinum]
MSKDYKHRIPGYRKRRLQIPKRWSLAAAGIGGTLGLAVYLFSDPDSAQSPQEPDTVAMPAPPPQAPLRTTPGSEKKSLPEQAQKPDTENKKAGDREPRPIKPREPRFTFYKILPEKEVIIPESEIKTIKREEKLGKQPASAPYLVQAGSFDNRRNAEQLKVNLAKIKIKARIEMIELDNSAWYRVNIGPYATLADADKIRAYLRTKGVDSIVQKTAK